MGKHHDKEFKMHVARLVVEEGRKTKELSEEINVSLQTLRNWVNTYKEKSKEGYKADGNLNCSGTNITNEKDKIIKSLKEENEILKKAMHILVKEPK
ncbi:transposase [Halalkalibacter flavus]|jgi:transposase|uniref:transposase n=1 Tax=Halalkalibacter flavus TaxID=3090668 RepID=UPI002FC87CDA